MSHRYGSDSETRFLILPRAEKDMNSYMEDVVFFDKRYRGVLEGLWPVIILEPIKKDMNDPHIKCKVKIPKRVPKKIAEAALLNVCQDNEFVDYFLQDCWDVVSVDKLKEVHEFADALSKDNLVVYDHITPELIALSVDPELRAPILNSVNLEIKDDVMNYQWMYMKDPISIHKYFELKMKYIIEGVRQSTSENEDVDFDLVKRVYNEWNGALTKYGRLVGA